MLRWVEKALSLLEELSVSIDEQAAAATACTELAVALLGLLCTWIHECPMAVRTGSRILHLTSQISATPIQIIATINK